ncbi:hypothetical protein [Acinetobacter portensis]|uniref:hypothetical protein n=1 Tax=Acinetobacter portensis TaxID=1839785 RepID=UPI0013D868F5|nr:hypothetical protein [Acinetobacter portensis]
MKRIDTINARENMFGIGKSGFHDNADLPGQDATYVSPEWFNTVQEELCNLLELRGITLDHASKRQLYDLLTTQVDLEALADEIETNFIRKNQITDNLTTNDANKPVSAKQAKILQDNKLEKTGATATNFSLSNVVTREVTGSNYTITYNDSNRIAIIRMRVFTNKTVDGSGVFTVDEGGGYYKALITLPITLQKRISADFLLAAASGGVSWINEAGEWLVQCDPIGSNGVTESKVGVHLTAWRGSAREEVDGYLEVVGIF